MRLRTPLLAALAAAVLLTGCTLPGLPRPSVSPDASASASPIEVPTPQTEPGGDSPDRRGALPLEGARDGITNPPPGSGLARYYAQTITWGTCDTDYQCATFLAPLDYADPDGRAITLAMRRRPAVSAEVGTMFINPGGPGGSAADYVTYFETSGLDGWTIVGLDPRGTGNSTPIGCGTLAETDDNEYLDYSPDDAEEESALIGGSKAFADQCRNASGDLLEHISSIDMVHDHELARALLGLEKFNYYGVSYGTYLGALYAQLYPDRVGRLILDSPVDLTGESEASQGEGFDRALGAFAADCAGRGCSLGSTAEAVLATIDQFLMRLDSEPMEVNGWPLTQSTALSGIGLYLYRDDSSYEGLETVLVEALRGEPAHLIEAALAYSGRQRSRYDTLRYAFPAIRCLDSSDDGMADAMADWHEAVSKLGPTDIYRKYSGPDTTCPYWRAEPLDDVVFTGEGVPPFLLLASTGDNATPYENAYEVVKALPSARLVTRVGAGHGAWRTQDPCVRDVMLAFLADGTLPAEGFQCT